MNRVFTCLNLPAVHHPLARRIIPGTFPLILKTAVALGFFHATSFAHDSSIEPGIFDHSEGVQADLSAPSKQERLPRESVRMASSRGGQWSEVVEWPLLAVHASLLPNGKVLAWDATPDDFDEDPHTASSYTTRVTVWDPLLGTHTAANNDTDTDLFCAGSAHLWDGRVLFAGGDSEPSGRNGPLSNTNVYDPIDNSWQRMSNMHAARWYSGVTPLANGEMLTLGGSYSPNPLAEVFQLDQTWRRLDLQPPYSLSGDYQWFQSGPDGNVLYFGPHDLISTIDTDGTGRWQVNTVRDGVGYRGYGSYAMYRPDRILITGGGDSLRSSVVVDAASKHVAATNGMNIGRRQHNLTILADGSVLASGGNSSGSDLIDLFTGVFEPEVWHPDTGQWQVMNAMSVDRQYHSIAILLPDGRVLSAGGGYCGLCTFLGYHEQNAEIFSPAYLFNDDSTPASRPMIVAAPASVNYNETFNVTMGSGDTISRAHLIKLGSVTHSQNQDQRLVPLDFDQTGAQLQLRAPSERGSTPPGHYMLFVLRGEVPSVAAIIRVGEPQLLSNQRVNHQLRAGERHWFEVESDGGYAYLSAALGQLDADVDLLIHRDRVPDIASPDSAYSCASRAGGVDTEWCNVELQGPGSWFVGVQSQSANTTNYSLQVSVSNSPVTSAAALLSQPTTVDSQAETARQSISSLDNPTAPPRLWSRTYSPNAAELFWDASIDNGFIAGYEVYRNSELLRRFDARSLYMADLVPNVDYNFTVRAFDDEGKFSAFTNTLTLRIDDAGQQILSQNSDEPTGDAIPQIIVPAGAPGAPAVPEPPESTPTPEVAAPPVMAAAPVVNDPPAVSAPLPVPEPPVVSSPPVVPEPTVPAPAAALPEQPDIVFRLVNARTNRVISAYSSINDGDSVSLSRAGESQLNIEAFAADLNLITRVRFDFNGKNGFRTESFSPYALFGDIEGDFIGMVLGTGRQALTARFFRDNRQIAERRIVFQIVR